MYELSRVIFYIVLWMNISENLKNQQFNVQPELFHQKLLRRYGLSTKATSSMLNVYINGYYKM